MFHKVLYNIFSLSPLNQQCSKLNLIDYQKNMAFANFTLETTRRHKNTAKTSCLSLHRLKTKISIKPLISLSLFYDLIKNFNSKKVPTS